MGTVWILIAGLAGLVVGGLALWIVERVLARSTLERANSKAAQVLEEARTRAKQTELAAEKDALDARNEAEEEAQKRVQELRREDERLQQRREAVTSVSTG